MILMSFAWSPKLFKLQVATSGGSVDNAYGDQDEYEGGMEKIKRKTARHRMTLILSFVKLILIPCTSIVIAKVHIFQNLSSIRFGFLALNYLPQGQQMLAMCIVVVASSFVGSALSLLACMMNLQKVCFAVPLLLSTPVALVIVLVPGACDTLEFIPCLHGARIVSWPFILLGALLWLSQVLSMNYQIFRSQQFLMAKEELLFWLPTYDGKSDLLIIHIYNNILMKRFDQYHCDTNFSL